MKELTKDEINLAIEKIRSKYDNLIAQYNKSPTLKNGFEDRYIITLKTKKNLSMFLLAEIDALEQIFKKEEEKIAEAKLKREIKKQPSFADKVLQENREKYLNYPAFFIHQEADDELEHLLGALRELLNDHLLALKHIADNSHHTSIALKTNKIYSEFIEKINFSGEPPLAKHYQAAIQNNKHTNGTLLEHLKCIQDCGFLINMTGTFLGEMLDYLHNSDYGKTLIKQSHAKTWFAESAYYKNLLDESTYAVTKQIYNRVQKIISDFRLKSIKI